MLECLSVCDDGTVCLLFLSSGEHDVVDFHLCYHHLVVFVHVTMFLSGAGSQFSKWIQIGRKVLVPCHISVFHSFYV